jgi:protein SCO1
MLIESSEVARGIVNARPVGRALAALLLLSALALVAGCNSGAASQDASNGDCLPSTHLVDQNGKSFSMASLKGRPVLADFIFTSCPGPCKTLTAKVASVASKLGPDLGSKVAIVSISVDPEHDTPDAMLKYSKEQGAEYKGWTFVTGSSDEIERVMNAFHLQLEEGSDGSVGHVADMFLVGRDGREIRQYDGDTAKPGRVVDDLRKALGSG